MRHTSAIEVRRRLAAGRPHGDGPSAGQGLFRPARAARYYGGLWFKVFSERGPC